MRASLPASAAGADAAHELSVQRQQQQERQEGRHGAVNGKRALERVEADGGGVLVDADADEDDECLRDDRSDSVENTSSGGSRSSSSEPGDEERSLQRHIEYAAAEAAAAAFKASLAEAASSTKRARLDTSSLAATAAAAVAAVAASAAAADTAPSALAMAPKDGPPSSSSSSSSSVLSSSSSLADDHVAPVHSRPAAAPARAAPPQQQQQQQQRGRERRIADAMSVVLSEVADDTSREGLAKTPQRVARALMEFTSGYALDAAEVLGAAEFDENYHEMVIVKDIDLFSLCEHHMVPFYGKCHIAYLPRGKVVGLSKLARLVDVFAKRLQVQERLTTQIADCIHDTIHARGVAVYVEATHLCMSMRGVRKDNARTTTVVTRGEFASDRDKRKEFLDLVRR